MIIASIKDKEHILHILEGAFKENPTLTSLSRRVNDKINIRLILEYAFYFSIARQGVYLSNDRSSVAFFYPSTAKGGMLEKWYLLKFIIAGIKLNKIKSIYAHLRKIKKLKPKNYKFYHFWFLGSKDGSVKSTRMFIRDLFKLASLAKSPIFAETTLIKNEVVFSKFGFKTYSKVKSTDLELKVSLMKKSATL